MRSNTDSLVRVGHRRQARDRRDGRRGARRDHEAARLDLELLADRDRLLIDEARRALDHTHAEPGEARPGIVRRNGGDDAVHVLVHAGEIDGGLGRRNAEHSGAGHLVRAPRGCQQRLRRHAAGVEALAAHSALLDQHHRHAETGSRSRDREAAGARADDADVRSEHFSHCRPLPAPQPHSCLQVGPA